MGSTKPVFERAVVADCGGDGDAEEAVALLVFEVLDDSDDD